MIEIKFRAWDEEICEIVNIDKIDFNLGYGYYVDSKGEIQRVNIKDCLQFTGLKDKNGKEIYEGDIIEGIRYDKEEERNVKFRMVVDIPSIFREDLEAVDECGAWIYDYKVIGNKFENPELLK